MRLFSTIFTLVLACVCSFGLAQEKKKNADVSGTWRYEYELEGQTRKDSLLLNTNKEGVVTGTYVGVSDKPVELKAGKVVGDEVTLDVEITYQSIPVKVKFKGKVKGDDIVGNVTAETPEGELPFEWVAKRSVEASDTVGEWQLEIDAGERVVEPKIVVALDGKNLKGKYVDSASNVTVDLENVRVEKNNLKFTVNVKMDVGSIKADFSGRPYGSKISGTVEYNLNGESGQVEFKGDRKAAAKEEAKK